MDIKRRMELAEGFTPAEQQLAGTVLALGGRLHGLTIKELARAAHVSIPSVHRFCKKLGLEGFKELKVELARSEARRADQKGEVDINFPFAANDTADAVLAQMASVYQTTLADTRDLLDPAALERAAELLDRARGIDIYTQSHNLYPAQMFCDRLLSIGRSASCFESGERQTRIALASDCHHVAIAISYSGLGPNLATILPILHERNVPTIFVGTPNGCRLNPGLDVYLHVSDRESLQNRITQFASHIAVQYVLDSLYGCLFARDYANSRAFLERSLPATSLPALRRTELSPTEYASVMLNRLR
ncbi:MurR/RpiR family transcriptional regulator [Collinsella stercoris]|uniref:MurR/RpiR family transcriptional regulator n=1 Tax=Collinsella stercoris TaxID=147206 RepID=UPI00248E22AF|nr:MurR/RpiR family transcriptional regulator [Collinsella stercoris]